MRSAVLLAIGAIAVGLVASIENAAAQPTAGHQIRLIVPFPAGGPTDIVARPFAQLLGEALKSVVVIDNRGGAGGSLGADAVAKSAPDGRTLLMGTVGTHAINPALYKTLPYDPQRDFTPIAPVAMAPVTLSCIHRIR
jgi:tripartite-type tricarboxylate transporter receptor subunit TctC